MSIRGTMQRMSRNDEVELTLTMCYRVNIIVVDLKGNQTCSIRWPSHPHVRLTLKRSVTTGKNNHINLIKVSLVQNIESQHSCYLIGGVTVFKVQVAFKHEFRNQYWTLISRVGTHRCVDWMDGCENTDWFYLSWYLRPLYCRICNYNNICRN